MARIARIVAPGIASRVRGMTPRGNRRMDVFFSSVLDESHTVAAMREVELNPVRAGLAREAH